MIYSANQAEIFLHPGQFHFGSAPGKIGTLLGSCVSVTLWHPTHHVGGMCHILLPTRQRPPAAPLDARYADEAVALLAEELKARHYLPASCQVKLFGGGDMFAGTLANSLGIGRRNIAAVRQALAEHGFSIMKEHVGGTRRRRLFFDLASGHVWLALPEGRGIQ